MHEDTVWDPAVHGNLQNQIREMILKVQEERARHRTSSIEREPIDRVTRWFRPT